MIIRCSCRHHCSRPAIVNALRSRTPLALRYRCLTPSSVCPSNHRLHHVLQNFTRRLSTSIPAEKQIVPTREKVSSAPPQPLFTLLDQSADSWEREIWLDSGWDLSQDFVGEQPPLSLTDHVRSYLYTNVALSSRPIPPAPQDLCEGPPLLEAFERELESGKSGKLAARSYREFKQKEPSIPLTSKALALLTRDFALLGMSKELLTIWDEERLKATEVVELWKFTFEGIEQERKDAALRKFVGTCREVGRERLAALLTQKVDMGLNVTDYSAWDLPLVEDTRTLPELRDVIREIQDSGRQISRPTSEAIVVKLLKLDAVDDAISLVNNPRLHARGSKNVSRIIEKIRYGQFEKGYLFVKGLLKSAQYLTLTGENLQAAFRLTLRPTPLFLLWDQLPSDALPKRDISYYTLKAFFQRVIELTGEPVYENNPAVWKKPRKSATAFRQVFTQCMHIIRKEHGWTQKLLAPSFATIMHRLIWHWDTGSHDREQQRRDPQYLVPSREARLALNSLSPELLEYVVHQVMQLGADINATIAKKRLTTWRVTVPEGKVEIWPFPVFWSWMATLRGTPLWDDPESEAMRVVEKVVYMKGLSIPYLKHRSHERKVLFLLRNRLQKYLEWQGKLQQDRSSVDKLIQKIWQKVQNKKSPSCYAVAVFACMDLKLGDEVHLLLFKDFCEVLARLGHYEQLMKMLKQAHTNDLELAPDDLQEVVKTITKYDAGGILDSTDGGAGKNKWKTYRRAAEALARAQDGPQGTKGYWPGKEGSYQRDSTLEEGDSEESPFEKGSTIHPRVEDEVEGERIL